MFLEIPWCCTQWSHYDWNNAYISINYVCTSILRCFYLNTFSSSLSWPYQSRDYATSMVIEVVFSVLSITTISGLRTVIILSVHISKTHYTNSSMLFVTESGWRFRCVVHTLAHDADWQSCDDLRLKFFSSDRSLYYLQKHYNIGGVAARNVMYFAPVFRAMLSETQSVVQWTCKTAFLRKWLVTVMYRYLCNAVLSAAWRHIWLMAGGWYEITERREISWLQRGNWRV